MQISGISGILFQIQCNTSIRRKEKLAAGQWKTTHTWNYSCRRVRRRSENNSTFSTVFTHVSVRVDKHENPFIYKGTVWSILDNVSFMVSCRPPPLTPPDHKATQLTPPRLVIGHIHLIWRHQGRYCSGFLVHQEKWSLFTEAAIRSEL